MAEGHPFQYNAGEAASTGATSLLHTGILAAAHRVGIRGEGLIAFAILSGAALYLATVKMARDVGVLLGGRREGWLAGRAGRAGRAGGLGLPLRRRHRAVHVPDHVAAALAAGRLADGAIRARGRPRRPGRPDPARGPSAGHPRRRRMAARARATRPRRRGRAALGRGRGRPAGPREQPRCSPARGSARRSPTSRCSRTSAIPAAVGIVAEYGVDVIRGLLLGFYPSSATIGFNRGWAALCFPPLGLLLIAAAALRRHPLTPPVRLWLLAAAVLFALVSPNMFLGVHFNRYILWAFPTLLALVAVGTGVLARAAGGPRDRAVFNGVAVLFLVLGGLSTLRFAALYGEMAGEIHRRDLAAARWIARSLPRGRRHGQRRDERRVPDRPPERQPARGHQPRVPRHPGRRARGRHAGGAGPPHRSAALPDHDRGQPGGLRPPARAGGRPAAVPDHELRRRDRGLPHALRRAGRRGAGAPSPDRAGGRRRSPRSTA